MPKMQEKILQLDFTDFLKQMRLLKNMGSLGHHQVNSRHEQAVG